MGRQSRFEPHLYSVASRTAFGRISRLAPATNLGSDPLIMGSPPCPKNAEAPPIPMVRARPAATQSVTSPVTQTVTDRLVPVLCPFGSKTRQGERHVLRLSPTTEYPASRSRHSRSQPSGRDAGYSA